MSFMTNVKPGDRLELGTSGVVVVVTKAQNSRVSLEIEAPHGERVAIGKNGRPISSGADLVLEKQSDSTRN